MSKRPADAVTVWPARVTLAGGQTFQTARVATTLDRIVQVWVVQDRTPTLVASIDRDDLEVTTTRGRRSYLATDGTRIERATGCGCGHPLARFRPPVEVS